MFILRRPEPGQLPMHIMHDMHIMHIVLCISAFCGALFKAVTLQRRHHNGCENSEAAEMLFMHAVRLEYSCYARSQSLPKENMYLFLCLFV